MKKSSLGRKSCARDGVPRKSEMLERKIVMPTLRRSSSTLSLPAQPTGARKRDLSLDRVSSSGRRDNLTDRMSEYNSTMLHGDTLRTPRSGLFSGRSSCVSSKKGDIRQLNDKEWQAGAVDTVVRALSLDGEGSDILRTYKGVRSGLSLACFIDICSFLLQKLDKKVFINKANYLMELPYHLKKLAYKGKIDKNMLQTVYTLHVWPHVLGIFHFLAELVLAGEDFTANHLDIMFPTSIENDSLDTDDLNFKFFLPIFKYSWNQHLTENVDIQELLKINRDVINKAIHSSGLTYDIFEKEMQIRKMLEEAKQKNTVAVENSSKTQSEFNEVNDHLSRSQDKAQSLQKELDERRLNCRREAESTQQIDRDLLNIEKEINSVGAMIAQCKNSNEDSLTLEEYEMLKTAQSKLENDLRYEKKGLFDLEELLINESLSAAKLEQENEKLFRKYNKKFGEIVKEDLSLRGGMCHTKPSIGQTPCNEATADLFNKAFQSYQARINQLEQLLKDSSTTSAQQLKLSEEIKDKSFELDKLKSIHEEEIRKLDQIKCELEQKIVRASNKKEELAQQIQSTQQCLENNHKEYPRLENEFTVKENRLRQYYSINKKKLEIRYATLVDLDKKYSAFLDGIRNKFVNVAHDFHEHVQQLKDSMK